MNPSRPCISCSGSRTWRQYCYAKQDTQSNNPSLLFGSSTQTYDDSPSTQSSYLSQVWNRGSGPTNSNNASAYCQYDGSPYGSHTYSRGGTIDPSSAKKIVDASETKPPPPAATPCQARHRQQYCHPQHLLSSLAGGFLFSVLHREKPNHAHCAGNARSSPAPLWSSFPGHHTPVHTTLLLAIVLFLLLFIAIAALTSNLAGPDTVDSWPPLACVLTGLGASCLYHRHVRGRESVVGDRKGGLGVCGSFLSFSPSVLLSLSNALWMASLSPSLSLSSVNTWKRFGMVADSTSFCGPTARKRHTSVLLHGRRLRDRGVSLHWLVRPVIPVGVW